VNPSEVEQLLRLDKLRREVDAMARRSVLQMVITIAVAFGLGATFGHFWR
jgi:hypothetical protein